MAAVIPIVEGHGEQKSVRILLQRIGYELLDAYHIEVLRPIRVPKSKLIQEQELQKAVELAARKATAANQPDALVLIMLDGDNDLPCELGPKIVKWATEQRGDFVIACEIIAVEYETWFVGGAESLREYLNLDDLPPENPEEIPLGKGWIQKRYKGASYSETVDQPAMTNALDLTMVKDRCPSFARLCRLLERYKGS